MAGGIAMSDETVFYFDNNATTRVAPEVVEALLPFYTEQWGNPSSAYAFGNRVGEPERMERVDFRRRGRNLRSPREVLVLDDRGLVQGRIWYHRSGVTNRIADQYDLSRGLRQRPASDGFRGPCGR